MVGMSTSAPSSTGKRGDCPACPDCSQMTGRSASLATRRQQEQINQLMSKRGMGSAANASTHFPATMSNFMVDYATIPRDDFLDTFDIGIPIDETKNGASDVLLLYTGEDTLPRSAGGPFTSLTATDATKNCNTVKVILQGKYDKLSKTCMAIVPQWESYYIHKYMRLPTRGSKGISSDADLRYVSRNCNNKGVCTRIPEDSLMKTAYSVLQEYLEHLPEMLEKLTPLAEAAASNGKTVFVLVCNWGQAELFHNFVCNAQAKGLDLSNLLMFSTDLQTHEMCQKLGIKSFYDEVIFKDMPEAAARGYGDRIFAKMMMAKVYCVHLANALGYNVVFQDVDVIWYRNPLEYFENPENVKEWDMMFQDDGARSDRYAPYSPNTGEVLWFDLTSHM